MQQTKNPYTKHLFVCANQREGEAACCALGGAAAIHAALKEYVKTHGLSGQVRVSRSGCQDLCEQGPNVMVFPDGFWYHHVQAGDVEAIIQAHLAPLVTPSHPPAAARDVSAIRVLLFDLGNVLLPFDHLRAVRALTPYARRLPDLYQSFFESPLQALHDEGKLSGREFYERIRQEYGLTLPYEQFMPCWNEIFWEDPAMTALVHRLGPQYRLVGISNTNRLHFDYVRRRYPVVREIATWIVSYEVGARKPDPRIYQRAIEASGVSPAEILYVDDRLDLVEAGRALGLNAQPFISAQRLGAQLADVGVQVAG